MDIERCIASLARGRYRQLGCAWLINSQYLADEVRDRLAVSLPFDDRLLVLGIGLEGAWQGLSENEVDWLLGHIAERDEVDPVTLISTTDSDQPSKSAGEEERC